MECVKGVPTKKAIGRPSTALLQFHAHRERTQRQPDLREPVQESIIQGPQVRRSPLTRRSAPAPVLRSAPFVAMVKAADLRESDDAYVA
jgi:hypothetical protein